VSLDLSDVRVAVLGLGVSGQASARALRRGGAVVTLVDDDAAPHPDACRLGAPVIGGRDLDLDEIDLVVASPGWPPWRAPLSAAVGRVDVWSEVELAWRTRARPDAAWLCLTGTNGKTTTVEMTGAIARAAGRRAIAAGNVGRPLVEAVSDPTIDVFACELSSFQLHFTHSLAPTASLLLNIAPDHLDWHESFDEYIRDKARVADGAERAVVVGPDAGLGRIVDRWAHPDPAARRVRVTPGPPARGELGVADCVIVDRAWADDTGREVAAIADIAHLAPPANARQAGADMPRPLVLDALGAIALARAGGVDGPAIGAGLRGFALGEHRMSIVGRDGGIVYINDSKATNPHATEADFDGFAPRSVVWIAGGQTKGTSMDALVRAIGGTLRGAVVIGKDRTPFTGPLRRHAPGVPVVEVPDGDTDRVMGSAVREARHLAQGSGVVLLAPAAASWDQFASYAERGKAFVAAVMDIEEPRGREAHHGG
jgi:UDP-N-acetylmuramoylalanine--D-glutamate ligase